MLFNIRKIFEYTIYFFLLIYINTQEEIKNQKYFEYFYTKNILNDPNPNYLETQKIQKIDMNEKEKENSLHNYIFKINEPYTGSESTFPKTAQFLKYRNFTIEKNFQISFKIQRNFTEDYIEGNIQDTEKNQIFIWLVKNNKFNFEAIRKTAEFNGLALKITNSEIKLIIAKELGIMMQKPFFDVNDDYKNLVEEKIFPFNKNNSKEDIFKITSINNFIFVEKFNDNKNKWEIIYFDKLTFHTTENFGVNIEIMSALRNEKEFFILNQLEISPIKDFLYDNDNENHNNNSDNYNDHDHDKNNYNKTKNDEENLNKKDNEDKNKKLLEELIDKLSNDPNSYLIELNNSLNNIKKILKEKNINGNLNVNVNLNANINENFNLNKDFKESEGNKGKEKLSNINKNKNKNEDIDNFIVNFPKIISNETSFINNDNPNNPNSYNNNIDNKNILKFNSEKLNEIQEISNKYKTIANIFNEKENKLNFTQLEIKNMEIKRNFEKLEINLKKNAMEFNAEIRKIFLTLFENEESIYNKFIDIFTFTILLLTIFTIYLINKFINILLDCKEYQHIEMNRIEKCVN
jgi:hypothetical protein